MASNPFNITQVDVPGLIAGYQNQQDRRVNQMLLQRKIALEDRELERQEKTAGIMAQFRSPQQGGGGRTSPAGGMSAAYAPPAAAAPVSAGPASIPQGSPLSPAASQSVAQAPAQPAAPLPAPPQTWLAANEDMLSQLQTVDAAAAFDMRAKLQGLDDAHLKHAQAITQTMAQAAEHLSSFPTPQARAAELQRITPDLVASGIPQEAIARADLSDQGIQWQIVHGMDLEHIIAREKEERTFAETQRHNMATERTAAGNLEVARGGLGVRQGALGLARSREGRVAAKGAAASAGGDVGALSTEALVRMATGQ